MKTANTDSVAIRYPEATELAQAGTLAEDVMGQGYRHLLGGIALVPHLLKPWSNSRIAQVAGSFVDVGITRDDPVSDLWLRPQAPGGNTGPAALAELMMDPYNPLPSIADCANLPS
ncbi:MAG TPA: hypothetical protein VMZ32_07425 [Gammaproteobacteria bacterium]|nr:hypothetical protein [Gammaproteobacteria bacterium]